jgi:5'-3' exonuclease
MNKSKNKMGIKGLNRYIRENCKKSTNLVHLSKLVGKKIAVDISIYLYKYEGEKALLENMYRMMTIFRYYGIIPLFVFDGKPPEEKKAVLLERQQKKATAETKYREMETELLSCQETGVHNKMQYELLDQLKKQCVYMTREKIFQVKDLIVAMGCNYVDAVGEADELCSYLVLHYGFWACLSDDTDMFVYGCHRVLRYMSLMNHTVICYEMESILEELRMTQNEFRNVCILAGSDYSLKGTHLSIHDALQYFNKYISVVGEVKETRSSCIEFYEWLEHTGQMDDGEVYTMKKTQEIFDLENKDSFLITLPLYKENTENLHFHKIHKYNLKHLLMDSGFLFYSNVEPF